MFDFLKLMFGILPKEEKKEEGLWHLELHGHDLNKWNYMGHSTISYNVDGIRYDSNIFFFIDKKNDYIRSYILKNGSSHIDFKHHNWIASEADTWQACERSWYYPVITEPSSYMIRRMMQEHNYVWDKKKKWWVDNVNTPNDKYEEAVAQTKRKPKVTKEGDKIVKLDFTKKDE